MKRKIVMTDSQKEFAIQNHNLIYSFLYKKNLSIETYYDIVVFGYLRAVVNYDERPELRQYCFSTIAWKAMYTDLTNYYRFLNRKKRKADVISFDACLSDDNSFSLLETISSDTIVEKSIEDKAFWREVYTLLNDEQANLIQMKLSGYSNRDICRELQISLSELNNVLLHIGDCIKNLFDSNKTIEDASIEESEADVAC